MLSPHTPGTQRAGRLARAVVVVLVCAAVIAVVAASLSDGGAGAAAPGVTPGGAPDVAADRGETPPPAADHVRVASSTAGDPTGAGPGAAAAGDPGPAALRVQVRDARGAPVVDVGIRVERARAGRAREDRRATTGADGVAAFVALPAGLHRVHVHGAQSREVTLAAGDAAELEVTVARGVGVEGRVVDAFGTPVAGAVIWGMPGSHLDHGRAVPVGRSRFDGRFRLDGYAIPLRTWLAARAPGHGASPWRQVMALDEPHVTAALRGLELRLGAERASLRGVCLDAAGAPCAGVAVHVAPLGVAPARDGATPLWPGHEYEAVTGDDGRFRFDDLAGGAWTVTARADGLWFEPVEAVLRSGDVVAVELGAEVAATVHCRVTDLAGEALAGAFVRAGDVAVARAVADGRGALTLHDLPPRRVALRAFLDGYADYEGSHDLVSGPNAVTIEMAARAGFVGVLQDPRGGPLAGWRVAAAPVGAPDATGGATTSADGAFEFDVDDPVPHVFRVAPAGAGFVVTLDAAGPSMPGPDRVVLVVPDAARPAGVIVGELRGAGDVVRYALSLRDDDRGRTAPFGDAVVGESGDAAPFRLEPLPRGTYWLFVRPLPAASAAAGQTLGAYRFGPYRLANGQVLNVGPLAIAAPGRLEYALTVPVGCAPEDVKLQWRAAGSETWGRHDIDPYGSGGCAIAPGEYDVTIWGEGFLAIERRVTVPPPPAPPVRIDAVLEPGQRLPLELTLPEAETRAKFAVRDAAGRLAYADEFGADESRVVRRTPVLGRGRHTVEATGASGRRYTGEFVVESLDPTRRPLRPTLRAAR